MRRQTFGAMLAIGVVIPMAALASGRASLGLTVNIGDPPPPPVVVVREEPRCVVVPGSTVYVVQEDVPYDMFRYGVFWYVYNDGYWYRARGHRGPFRAIAVRYVPRAIVSVPARHWRHHPHGGPPGLVRKQRGHDHDVVVVKRGRGRDRGDD
jgi:hypothetical protein